MAQTSASAKAITYAAMSSAVRDAMPDAEHNELLAASYPSGKYLPAIGADVLRRAELLWLKSHPFTDPDRIGRYASLLLSDAPSSAVFLCLYDERKYLMETHLLSSGPNGRAKKYGVLIPELVKRAGATYLSVIFTPRAGDCGYTWEDEDLATRLTIYCKQQGLSILDCTVARDDTYVSLYRTLDYTP